MTSLLKHFVMIDSDFSMTSQKILHATEVLSWQNLIFLKV